MTMRIVQIGPYPPPYGGVQTHLLALRRFLLERGVPCDVINVTRFRRDEADGVYYPRRALEVARLLRRLPDPIIHLHVGGTVPLRVLALNLFCTLFPRRRTVLTFHSGGYPTSKAGRSAGPWTLRGLVFRRLDRVIAVNAAIAALFERFGLESGRVRERFPKAGLVIVGSGSLEARLRTFIGAKPYADSILLCGDLPHATTLRAIEDSDLLLRTTWYDGDSLSVREALHLGTPVIATDNGMRPEGIERIPPRDPAALLAAISRRLAESVPPPRPRASTDRNLQAVLEV